MTVHSNLQTPERTIRERAPLMLVFGILAGRVAELIRVRPSLAERLALAPPEALHSTAAYLHLVENPATNGPAELAKLIEDSHPRALLFAVLPNAPAQLYRALATAGSRARGRTFYRRLGEISAGPFTAVFLEGDLSDRRLTFFELLQTLDPAVAAIRGWLSNSCEIALAINDLVCFLRAHSTFNDAEFRFPEGAGVASVLRRLQIALDRVHAPVSSFVPPPAFRMIESIGELRQVGRDFKNCLQHRHHYASDRWFALADGSSPLSSLTIGAPTGRKRFAVLAPGTLCLRCLSSRNEDVGGVREAVIDSLRQHSRGPLLSLNTVDDVEAR